MSTLVEVLRPAPREEPGSSTQEQVLTESVREHAGWSCERFEAEQIRRLVRQIFLPGWPKPLRQVVFSAVDEKTPTAGLCLRIAETLASQASGSVCVVEAAAPEDDFQLARTSEPRAEFRRLRDDARRISSKLWVVPQEILMGASGEGFSPPWLRGRLAELRLEFDYTVIQGPSAAVSGGAALLAHLSDGVVLVLEANATRRATARSVKKNLQAAHARIIGTVLSQRTFPIPQSLYERL